MNRRITILVHETDPYPKRYDQLIWVVSEFWKRMGIRITVLKGLSTPPPPSDLLIPHVDLTQTPEAYTEYINRFTNVINRTVTDISKRAISTNLLTRDDPYDGPAIIKTNFNCGGMPEKRVRLAGKEQTEPAPAPGESLESIDFLRSHNYPVFAKAADVPQTVWRNPNLVVEKFIAERQGPFFAVRVCLFLGDVVLTRRVFARSPVVKGSTITHSEEVEAPPELAGIRRRLGFDYGKFDYVVHDGRMQLLDANKTPSGLNDRETNLRISGALARAVLNYFDRVN